MEKENPTDWFYGHHITRLAIRSFHIIPIINVYLQCLQWDKILSYCSQTHFIKPRPKKKKKMNSTFWTFVHYTKYNVHLSIGLSAMVYYQLLSNNSFFYQLFSTIFFHYQLLSNIFFIIINYFQLFFSLSTVK